MAVIFVIFILVFLILIKSLVLVKEGTAVAIMKFGKFEKIIFQWQNHWMDQEWNIWRENEPEAPPRRKNERKLKGKIIGGLFFYGLWPIYNVHTYLLRWTDIHRSFRNEKIIDEIVTHEEWKSEVLLKPAVYATKLFDVETKVPERIPVTVEILITMRIFNPYLFLFVAPPTPLDDILARFDTLLRERISRLSIDDLLSLGAEDLWLGVPEKNIPPLKDEKFIRETLLKWGVKVAEKGIEIKSITPPPEYAKALAQQREMELKAKGVAAETVGAIVEMMAKSRGKEAEEIQKEIDTDPELKREFLKQAEDLIVRKLGIEGNAYLDIRVQGAEGFEKMILDALALWKKIPPEISKKETELEQKSKPEVSQGEISQEEKEEEDDDDPEPDLLKNPFEWGRWWIRQEARKRKSN
jgi:regulator of protease activity HflC (stomatin/prohibitin superfamily)